MISAHFSTICTDTPLTCISHSSTSISLSIYHIYPLFTPYYPPFSSHPPKNTVSPSTPPVTEIPVLQFIPRISCCSLSPYPTWLRIWEFLPYRGKADLLWPYLYPFPVDIYFYSFSLPPIEVLFLIIVLLSFEYMNFLFEQAHCSSALSILCFRSTHNFFSQCLVHLDSIAIDTFLPPS